MKEALLLVQGITLLHLNSQQTNHEDDARKLVRRVVTNIRLPEHGLGLDHGREVLQALKKTASWMCEQDDETLQDGESLLQRLKVDTEDEPSLYASLEGVLGTEMTERKAQRMVHSITKQINDHFLEKELGTVIRDISATYTFKRDSIESLGQFVRDAMEKLAPYQIDAIIKDPAIISDADFSDMKSVRKIFADVKKTNNLVGVLKTPWQGVNRMLQGGFRPETETVFGAMQHSFKSKFTRSLCAGIAMFNTPVIRTPGKTPLILLVSFEDPTQQVLADIFKWIYENETNEKCDKKFIESLDPDYIADFVMERLQATGFIFRVIYVDPHQWTYQKYTNFLTKLENEGYELHFSACDYLEKMPTTGCKQGAAGEDLHDLFARMKTYHSKRQCPFFTPHQLSSDAKMLLRQGATEFVKQVSGKGFWKGCKSIDQVVDIEMHGHIEKVNNESFYTIFCGKHRGVSPPEKITDLFTVYKIDRVGELRHDVNGEDCSRQFAGGDTMASGDTVPFWETARQE